MIEPPRTSLRMKAPGMAAVVFAVWAGCQSVDGPRAVEINGMSAVRLVGQQAIEIIQADAARAQGLTLVHGGRSNLKDAVVRVGESFRLARDGLIRDYRLLEIRNNRAFLTVDQYVIQGPPRGRNVTRSSGLICVAPYDYQPWNAQHENH